VGLTITKKLKVDEKSCVKYNHRNFFIKFISIKAQKMSSKVCTIPVLSRYSELLGDDDASQTKS